MEDVAIIRDGHGAWKNIQDIIRHTFADVLLHTNQNNNRIIEVSDNIRSIKSDFKNLNLDISSFMRDMKNDIMDIKIKLEQKVSHQFVKAFLQQQMEKLKAQPDSSMKLQYPPTSQFSIEDIRKLDKSVEELEDNILFLQQTTVENIRKVENTLNSKVLAINDRVDCMNLQQSKEIMMSNPQKVDKPLVDHRIVQLSCDVAFLSSKQCEISDTMSDLSKQLASLTAATAKKVKVTQTKRKDDVDTTLCNSVVVEQLLYRIQLLEKTNEILMSREKKNNDRLTNLENMSRGIPFLSKVEVVAEMVEKQKILLDSLPIKSLELHIETLASDITRIMDFIGYRKGNPNGNADKSLLMCYDKMRLKFKDLRKEVDSITHSNLNFKEQLSKFDNKFNEVSAGSFQKPLKQLMSEFRHFMEEYKKSKLELNSKVLSLTSRIETLESLLLSMQSSTQSKLKPHNSKLRPVS